MRNLIALFVFLAAHAHAAPPTLGLDCGVGATIQGSKNAGHITTGVGVTTCTLSFAGSWPKTPSCSAMNDTTNGGGPVPIGARATTTTLFIQGGDYWIGDGDVISYLCVGQ